MQLDNTVAQSVARAVVRLPRRKGQGVLVPGDLILTAAHCIGWTSEGGMALGDHLYEEIVTADGIALTVAPFAVEPVSDIAILGVVDNQSRPAEADAYEQFCVATAPVRLVVDEFELFTPIDGYVFTHMNTIVQVCATQCCVDAKSLFIESEAPIEGGTSGGPVVTRAGDLLGIISWTGAVDGEQQMQGSIPRPHVAAPVWLARRMAGCSVMQ